MLRSSRSNKSPPPVVEVGGAWGVSKTSPKRSSNVEPPSVG